MTFLNQGFRAIGRIRATTMSDRAVALVPAVAMLLFFPLASQVIAGQGAASVVALMAAYGLFAWLALPHLAKTEAATIFGSEIAVIVPVVLIAAMVAVGDPADGLRIFTAQAALRAVMLADDLRRGHFHGLRRLLPDADCHATQVLLTKALIGVCIAMALVVEVVIASGSLALWLIFAAWGNLLFVSLDHALAAIVTQYRRDVRAA